MCVWVRKDVGERMCMILKVEGLRREGHDGGASARP